MTEIATIGRIEHPELLDLEPITVPVAGYTLARKEVVQKFKFRPSAPAGAAMKVLRLAGPTGQVDLDPVLEYLEKALLPDERARWSEYLDRDDLLFEGTLFVSLFEALMAEYGSRPTLPQSTSPNGHGAPAPTSKAVSRARGSASKPKRSR